MKRDRELEESSQVDALKRLVSVWKEFQLLERERSRVQHSTYVRTYLVYLWMDCIIGKRCAYRVREGGLKWNYISLRLLLLHSILAVSHFKEKGGKLLLLLSIRERERETEVTVTYRI